jgi:hypothetical protein
LFWSCFNYFNTVFFFKTHFCLAFLLSRCIEATFVSAWSKWNLYALRYWKLDCFWNVMAHAQKPDFVFRRKERVHLNRLGRQFSRLLAAEVCASAVVMLGAPCSEVVWSVLATHSIRQFPLHFPSRASPCAITFQLDSSNGLTVWSGSDTHTRGQGWLWYGKKVKFWGGERGNVENRIYNKWDTKEKYVKNINWKLEFVAIVQYNWDQNYVIVAT